MRIYTETQEELTSELSDFKEKYREVVDLLRDTQNELKTAKKRSYPGMGEHKVSGMFDTNTTKESKTHGKKRHYFCYASVKLFAMFLPHIFIFNPFKTYCVLKVS